MGIDQIGKKGPPLTPPAEAIGGKQRAETRQPFEVSTARPMPSTPQVAPLEAPRTALDRWRAGEVDVHGYIDLKVDEATTHLALLPAQELQAIRAALSDRMASDPTLVELVGTATHRAPGPPGGDG